MMKMKIDRLNNGRSGMGSLLHLVLFSLVFLDHFNLSLASQFPSDDLLDEIECKLLYCGQGKCVKSSTTIFGADCECNSGWKKIGLGPLVFPACLIPNCSVNLQCGSGSPAPPPVLSPPPPPMSWFPNFSNPCTFVWCGDGSCKSNGTKYSCDCNPGSVNLLNTTSSACFKECSLGADCSGLNIAYADSPPPAPSPSGSTSDLHGHDSKGGIVSPTSSPSSSTEIKRHGGLRSFFAWMIVLQTLILPWW